MSQMYADPLFVAAEVAWRRESLSTADRVGRARTRRLLPASWHLPRPRRAATTLRAA